MSFQIIIFYLHFFKGFFMQIKKYFFPQTQNELLFIIGLAPFFYDIFLDNHRASNL